MDCRLIKKKEVWNNFLAGQTTAQFLQSWEWGEFQQAFGRRVWRLGFLENDLLFGAAQVFEHYLGLGLSYLYIPRGPIFKTGFLVNEAVIQDLVRYLKKEIINYGQIFIRLEPVALQKNLVELTRVASLQPAHTLLLNLSLSEDELLALMHQKTRYNIKLAEKKDLEFKISDSQIKKQDNLFWKLVQETSRRDGIKSHPQKYYQLMEEILNQIGSQVSFSKFYIFSPQIKTPLTAGLFIGFGDTFTYVHGASSNEQRELMAPYLLQWEAIKYAKQHGFKYYDFDGINPLEQSNFDYRKSWEGISRFKNGFGGIVKNYPGTWEIPLRDKSYKLLKLVKKIRKII